MRLLVVIFFLFVSGVYADDGFKGFLKKELGGFEEFKSQADKEFYEYLKTSWEEFKAFAAVKRDEKPKIKTPPVLNKKGNELTTEMKTKITGSILDDGIRSKGSEVKVTSDPKQEELEINLYKIDLKTYPKNVLIEKPITGEKIAEAWKMMATGRFLELAEEMRRVGKKMNFDDWGYFKFTKTISNGVYPSDYNSKIILSWFLLSKLGYDVKIGFNKEAVYMMVPANQMIYGSAFFRFGNVRYYLLWTDGREVKGLYSYSGNHQESKSYFSFMIEKQSIDQIIKSKVLSFSYDGKRYEFPVYYNLSNVKFYEDFPQTELSVYHKADVSGMVVASVVEGLRRVVEGKSEVEAVNILLRFVQTAFEYKTDQDNFGYEKYLLPDETVYYPYSDCEDRSILFSYLVRKILGLEVVLLEYPGHIATGVRFNENVAGDRVQYNDKIYVVSDPTYINASVGMAMPQFKNVAPKIIF
ncbi:MAG: hypothetical protein N3C60_02040 [Calditerrivibrio sp.]|nr:hypothetical protein [Calditerrivibrio sp.]